MPRHEESPPAPPDSPGLQATRMADLWLADDTIRNAIATAVRYEVERWHASGHSEVDADDVTQEVFEKFRGTPPNNLDNADNRVALLHGWTTTTARRAIIDSKRPLSEKRTSPADLDDIVAMAAGDSPVALHEYEILLRMYTKILREHYVPGLGILRAVVAGMEATGEIADFLGITVDNYYQIRSRMRKSIGDHLSDFDEPERPSDQPDDIKQSGPVKAKGSRR